MADAVVSYGEKPSVTVSEASLLAMSRGISERIILCAEYTDSVGYRQPVT